MWNATRSVIAWAGDQIARLGVNVNTSGNLGRSIIIGLVIFAAAILLVPGARAGRGLAISAVLSIVIALVLFQPSLGTSLRNAVSAPAPATVSLR